MIDWERVVIVAEQKFLSPTQIAQRSQRGVGSPQPVTLQQPVSKPVVPVKSVVVKRQPATETPNKAVSESRTVSKPKTSAKSQKTVSQKPKAKRGRPRGSGKALSDDVGERRQVPQVPKYFIDKARELFPPGLACEASMRDIVEAVLVLYAGLDVDSVKLDPKAEELVRVRQSSLSSTETTNRQLRRQSQKLDEALQDIAELRLGLSYFITDYVSISKESEAAAKRMVDGMIFDNIAAITLEHKLAEDAKAFRTAQLRSEGRLRPSQKIERDRVAAAEQTELRNKLKNG